MSYGRAKKLDLAAMLRPIAGRVPPHNLDAEAAVLSALLLEPKALDQALEVLQPEHFYSDANRRIYEAAQHLSINGSPVDIVTIAGRLRDTERLQQVGGAAYLAQLTNETPAVSNVDEHARVVFELWRLREAIANFHRLLGEAYGGVESAQAFLDHAEQSIYDIAHCNGAASRSVHVSVALKEAHAIAEAAIVRGDRLAGVSTGFGRLDRMLGGLKAGDLVIVAARPGLGKTSLLMSIAINVAAPRGNREEGTWHPGQGVFIASLEMPREQLAARGACSEARVDLGRFFSGELDMDENERHIVGSSFVAALPMWVDDTPAINLLKLRSLVRRRKAEHDRAAHKVVGADGVERIEPERKLSVVGVDYLQLMTGIGKFDNREQEIAQITRGLKQLAKELGVCVIALSQLNRAVETRSTKDKRPQLSDLRESGAIEQDADAVIMLYRDDYYNKNSEHKGIAELIVAKQRNGPTGTVYVRFDATCTRFDNLHPGSYPDDEA